MYYIFNIIIIVFVLIIAYWWANQGMFSALLHLLCVVVAGAIALGVWEPLVVNYLLRDTWFDLYAWGVTLLGVFAVCLFVLRQLTDRLAPANVDLPHWANMAFGAPLGAAAGILTVGMLTIGCGFLQSTHEIMGYAGYGRTSRNGQVVKMQGTMWMPVTMWTTEFYSWLSATSFWTPDPMRRTYPELHKQAWLIRDSYGNGKGQITLPPESVDVRRLLYSAGANRAAVEVAMNAKALDFGEQLTLSASQIRLISTATKWNKSKVAYPDMWQQDGNLFRFDSTSNYIVSTPGRENADAVILFQIPTNFVPKFIQIKGNRYRLPAPQALPPDVLNADLASGGDGPATAVDLTARPIPTDDLKLSNSIRPIRISSNALPGTFKEQEKYIIEGGPGVLRSQGASNVSRKLLIKGIFEPPGTRSVTLNVSRNKVADVFSTALRKQVPESAQMMLVDSNGNTYSPIGYLYKRGTENELLLAPGKYVRTLAELPMLPSAGGQEMLLYFRVTEDAEIVAFKVGDLTLGTTQLLVKGRM